MTKLTIADFKKHRHNVLLVLGYTLALLLVYASLTYAFTKRFWLAFGIAVLIILAGFIFLYIWIGLEKKKDS